MGIIKVTDFGLSERLYIPMTISNKLLIQTHMSNSVADPEFSKGGSKTPRAKRAAKISIGHAYVRYIMSCQTP